MRFGRCVTHMPVWFLLWPLRSGHTLARLFLFLVLTACCILAYIACTFQGTLQIRMREQHDANGQFGVGEGQNGNHSFYRTPGIVPVKCDLTSLLSEILRLPPIKFLPNFKNPCWYEPLDTPIADMYANNGFTKYSSTYEKAFNKMIKTWRKKDTNESHRLRCLPYFFLAGQPKCGSTDFYNRIVSHPDITTPPNKESHWWGKNRYGWCLNYTATIPFQDYVDLYDGAAMQIEEVVNETHIPEHNYHPVITGDASVSTLWSNDDWWKNPENCGRLEPRFTNADHVHMVLPQARVIVILRNPADRLYSDFLFFRHVSKSQHYFHKAVTTAIDALNECILRVGTRACVYNSTIAGAAKVRLRLGMYSVYLQDWLALFPRNQVMVVRLEDYSRQPGDIISEVHRFLDIRPLSEKEYAGLMDKPLLNTRRQSDRRLGGMLAKTKEILNNFYKPYNVQLAKLLGDDRFLWAER